MAQCIPDREAVRAFKVRLMPGEEALLDALLAYLPDECEVYVQPFVNGDRPDLVVVRRGYGALIIEVKDWDLSAYHTGAGAWRLRKNGVPKTSPVEQVETYKKNLFALHVEQLAVRQVFEPKTFRVVRCGVYLHDAATDEQADRACGSPTWTVTAGRESLSAEGVHRIAREGGLLRSDHLFDDELYEALRRYLDPGEHHPDEGTTIVYTESQKPVVESVAGHRRKVRGVAGCGKTRCLAGRAVAAHQRHGQPILLLTYNLALRNYIHDRVSDVREPFPWSAFHITNYHQFFKAQALYHNLPHHTLADAGRPGFFESVRDETRRYATILIDEVQDYESEWIQSLSDYFLYEAGGELVVFGDEKQNVYGRELDEKKLPRIPTVPGDWRTLTESHRLGPGSLRLAQAFQAAFFDGDYEPDAEVEQADLFAEAGVVRYHHRPGLGDDALFTLVQSELKALGVHPNQVAVLAPTIETLRTLDLRFRTVAHERTARTFETQEEHDDLVDLHGGPGLAERRQQFHWDLERLRRTRKLHFWPNPGTVKLSTVLSFKGWEAHTLVLVLREADLRREDSEMDETVYAALTRATTNAVVVATDGDGYRDFFAPHAVATTQAA